MTGDGHDGLVGNLRLCKLRYRMVSKIVESQPCEWTFEIPDVGLAFLIDASIGRLL